jgi:hypothetical protein
VILVISLKQEASATLTSKSECFTSLSAINAFSDGESALCIDSEGDCSTFDKQFSICCSAKKKK